MSETENNEVPRNPDEAYDSQKEEAKQPIAMQRIVLTFANGRMGAFMGPALMTNEEFRGMKDINLAHVDIGEPFVVKTEEPSPQASSAEETAL